MTEYTSIRVTKAAKEAAQESKADSETWNEFLQRCTDNPPEVREYVDADAIATGDVTLEASERRAIAQEVAEVLR